MRELLELYSGEVVHVRGGDVAHRLRRCVEMVLADVEHLDEAGRRSRLWGSTEHRPLRIAREDLLGDPSVPLIEEVRRVVAEATGDHHTGSVSVLCAPRFLGLGFNPIRCYFCFSQEGDEVEHLVLEVTNTPWGERHVYVIGPPGRHEFPKAFHVSPFLPMTMRYEVRYSRPAERLVVALHARSDDEGPDLKAVLSLRRRLATPRSLSSVLGRPGRSTIGSTTAIYGHALSLVAKRAPFFSHPRRATRKADR